MPDQSRRRSSAQSAISVWSQTTLLDLNRSDLNLKNAVRLRSQKPRQRKRRVWQLPKRLLRPQLFWQKQDAQPKRRTKVWANTAQPPPQQPSDAARLRQN